MDLYGKDNGHIWIDVYRKNKNVIICIADDGIGISPDEHSKIWKRFYQVNKHSEKDKGSGLGLSIIKWIVERHGGSIALSSKPGKGSKFTITLSDDSRQD